MKKLILAISISILASCASNSSDVEVISTFYEAVLGETEMTDELLKESLSQDVLDAIWEADYDSTYSFWVFRTGFQDGPSDKSTLEGIEKIGDGWYKVSYSDLGIHGVTNVKMEGGKIAAYKQVEIGDDKVE